MNRNWLKNLERLGLTQYRKSATGRYEKTAGAGPSYATANRIAGRPIRRRAVAQGTIDATLAWTLVAPYQRDGGRQIVGPIGDDAPQVQRRRMIGMDAQDVPAHLLRRRKPARLQMLLRKRQRFWNGK